jgi:hypothetical protein
MSTVHPIVKKATGLPPDLVAMATRQATEWDLMVGRLEGLGPNDVTAEELLRNAASLLSSITVNYGPIHGWLLSQNHLLRRTACRVWGPKQQVVPSPGWTEQF